MNTDPNTKSTSASPVSPDAEKGPQDALDILVQDLWDNGKNLDWDEWRQRITAYSGQRQVLPDAEAMVLSIYKAWHGTDPAISKHMLDAGVKIGAAALTAATMREREACAQWHIDQAQVFEKAQRDTGVFNRQVEWHKSCAEDILARSAQSKVRPQ